MLTRVALSFESEFDYPLLEFNPSGSLLALSDKESKQTLVVEVSTGRYVRRREWDETLSFLLFVSEQTLLVGVAGHALLWDTQTDATEPFADLEYISAAAQSPRGDYVALSGASLYLLDALTREVRYRLKPSFHGQQSGLVSFSPDGRYVVCDSPDPEARSGGSSCVQYWDVGTGRKVRIFDAWGQGDPVIAFQPHGTAIALAIDWELGIYSPDEVAPIAKYEHSIPMIAHLAFTPSGRHLEAVTYNGQYARIEPWTGEVLEQVPPPEGQETIAVAVSQARRVAGLRKDALLFWTLPAQER